VPPVLQWFECMGELEHKAYSKAKAQACLDSILSHPEIETGAIAFDKHKKLLTFSLKSSTLTVSDVDFGVSAGELARFHELLTINEAVNGKALHIGEPYERERDFQSWFVLDLLSRSQGRRTGISRTLHLDYEKNTAHVTYKIWEGPPGEPDQLVPPFAPPCPILNGNFNGFDWDDLTPVGYIYQQMKTKWLGCFSDADLREDEAHLKKLPFLKESKISVTGSGNSRDFSFHFRSNPIPITKVTVHGYGLLDNLSAPDISSLEIHPGDTYSETRLRQQEESLKKSSQRADSQLKVFTDVQIDAEGKAILDFIVLAYPDDVVYVNDKPYDVTNHRER
jgi:hypothetical protein